MKTGSPLLRVDTYRCRRTLDPVGATGPTPIAFAAHGGDVPWTFLSGLATSAVKWIGPPALIAFLTTLVTMWFSLRKLRRELTNQYAAKILEARLQQYPSLYVGISAFLKNIEGGGSKSGVEYADLVTLSEHVNTWDTQHGLLYSSFTSDAAFNARRKLLELLALDPGTCNAQLGDPSVLADLKLCLQRLEVSLRQDIGVHEVDKWERRHPLQSYQEQGRLFGLKDR